VGRELGIGMHAVVQRWRRRHDGGDGGGNDGGGDNGCDDGRSG
jgi:hypothetical protein